MSNQNTYTGTGFSHDIPFSNYADISRDDILNNYDDAEQFDKYEQDFFEGHGICINVVDGDTIDVRRENGNEQIRVRLVGINTPESNINGYLCSKKFTEKICLNQQVKVYIDSQKEKDNYDRYLGVVVVDNKNLNEILLKEGLAEVLYIPPSDFNPHEWSEQQKEENENTSSSFATNTIGLASTIINQKKKLFLYVSQSKNLVWPNSEYGYQVYVKNISGQNIEHIKIYITNPKEIVIPEKKTSTATYEIPVLKTGQSVLINIDNCTAMQEGYYHVNFIAMGDETEIKTQSLLIKCGYENDNKNTVHRISFYNFSPYEEAYMQRASDFSETVTQLTKIQTKPFEAYNQPFEMDELELDLYAQDTFLTNTDDMPSMYLGRENWESNFKETYSGETLTNLIQQINKKSDIVNIDLLRIGNNEMETNLQRIFPNGFIHRFGLMKSEFYKLLGIIPNIFSINDDLFRWARDERAPVIYPPRENDVWNQKPWSGTGYYVYEYELQDGKKISNTEKAIFSMEHDAEIYVEDLLIFNEQHFIDNIGYTIKRRDWLPGIFYVEIPLRDIPANFIIPSVDEIQAVIELSKPYGLKGYPRFQVTNSFMHRMFFDCTPIISPRIPIQLDDYQPIKYHIGQRKYIQTPDGISLQKWGLQAEKNNFYNPNVTFYNHNPSPSVCKKRTKDVRYFFSNHVPYIRIYSKIHIDKFNDVFDDEDDRTAFWNAIGTDIEILEVSQDNLISILHDNHIKIDRVVLDQGLESEENIPRHLFCSKERIFDDNILLVVKTDDNSISGNISIDDVKICTLEKQHFNGQGSEQNSLNDLIMKNPEDISFYIKENNQFIQNSSPNIPNLEIPIKYKTTEYDNKDTSTILNIKSNKENKKNSSAVKIFKQELPKHINVNMIFINQSHARDFIISYKRLYDDVYQISCKSYKNTEVVLKEIVTKFDYILCEISHISLHKDLIKVYYCLDGKLYFITGFVMHALTFDSDASPETDENDINTTDDINVEHYQVRIALTNDLTLDSRFLLNNSTSSYFIFGFIKNAFNNNWSITNKQYSNILSTDEYIATELLKTNSRWNKLYKINKDETSFSSFSNDSSETTAVNDIQLYLNNLDIPRNSIIDKISLDLYTDTRESVTVSTSYQVNTNVSNENDNKIEAIFKLNSYNTYTKNSLDYLYNQLRYYQEHNNEAQIEYYKMLIDENNQKNKDISINFNEEKPLIIKDSYWNEVGFDNTSLLKTSDVKQIYLIIEGYNHSKNVLAKTQLAHYDGIGTETNTEINSGYFYKRIPIDYNSKYDISMLKIRFMFENIQEINLYNVKAQIQFSKPQDINNPSQYAKDIIIKGLNKFSTTICENLDGDDVQNGLTIKLSFSDIQNYIKIYSAVVNIVYHEKAFTNIFEISPDFNMITADYISPNANIFGEVFDEKVSDMRQDNYTMKKPNGEYDAGFEMNHRIYQAFTAEEDNITSIELKLNGRTGAPDNYLKIAVLDNYDNLPNNVLKEIIVDVSKNQPTDGEAYKYNIYVDNLIIGNTYWFSIEPVDKTKQGSRRFLYNNHQVGDFKLLSSLDGDVINQHASLYFRLYSKANSYVFNQLPFNFDLKSELYTKDINLITSIQIKDGFITNLRESLFGNCILLEDDSSTGEDDIVIETDDEF